MEKVIFKWVCLCSLLLLLLLLSLTNVAFAGSIVKTLPGYDGELPFKLETGYISVDDSELFYYFIESQGNPKLDPLILWFTGGPGCSSFNGLIYEIGPMEFDMNYEGGLPKLQYYPYAWTKTASFIFIDSPVGTGFSYSRTAEGWPSSDKSASEQGYQFLRKWLDEHTQYLPVQLFIAGDSYSGTIVPLVVKKIVDGNYVGSQPIMNLKGYIVGSPHTDSNIDENSKVEFAHRMALISDEIYENAKISCNGSYDDSGPDNIPCRAALEKYEMCIKGVYTNHILEPKCAFASPPDTPRSLLEQKPPRNEELWCRNFNYSMAYTWSNDNEVQKALHVRPGMIEYWSRCNKSLSYTKNVPSVVDVHKFLSTLDLLVLVDSGDRDMVVPFVGTMKWIKSLNLTVDDEWRPWFVDGQVAGYTTTFLQDCGYRMTFAIVKGAGHTAPEYYRRECYNMFDRWVHYYPI